MRQIYCYLALVLAFLLGSHEGFIALWLTPGGEPDHIFPYQVTSLPQADQERLKAGIEIESPEALRQLLEDYLS